jgi:glycerol uptake facilitator-like aquaporin
VARSSHVRRSNLPDFAAERSGLGQWAGEFTATFGLIAVIESVRRHFASALPGAIAAYITAAYWFTSSTSFANPAVTIARALTDSFAGIAPSCVPAFVAAQLTGAAAALITFRWLLRRDPGTRLGPEGG